MSKRLSFLLFIYWMLHSDFCKIKMGNQIWSLEKYQMKNSFNKKNILIGWKKRYIMRIFLFEYKFVLVENILISYKYILMNINLFWFWLNKNIFWYQHKNYFRNISATIDDSINLLTSLLIFKFYVHGTEGNKNISSVI